MLRIMGKAIMAVIGGLCKMHLRIFSGRNLSKLIIMDRKGVCSANGCYGGTTGLDICHSSWMFLRHY